MVAPLVTIIALFGAWSAYWFVASAMAQNYAAGARQQFAARGLSLVCASEDWGGYPFRFEFDCKEPLLTLPGGQILRSGSLFAVAQAYDPSHVIALVDGPGTLTLPGGVTYAITHDLATLSVDASRQGTFHIAADIPNFTGAALFVAKDIQLHTRPAKDHANDIAITLENAAYNSPGKPPLIVDHAQLLATLADNHELAVNDLQLTQGTLKLWGKGTVGLDAAHRIAGRIASQTNDLNQLLAVLDPHIKASEQERATLKALLGLLGQQAKADFVAQDGDLFIGPLKIGVLLPLY